MSGVREKAQADNAITAEGIGIPPYFVSLEPTADGFDRYLATESTVSVWAPTMQHGAPPSALLARAIEHCAPRAGTRIGRLTMEILGPIPVSEIEVRAWIERPGKRVEMVAAELAARKPDGTRRVVATARAWRIATSDTAAVALTQDQPLPPVAETSGFDSGIPSGWDVGYVRTVDLRAIDGPGRRVWVRSLTTVVDDEPMTPLVRALAVVDIANGVGAQLDPAHWTFLNTDLTVDLFRAPEGEWIGLDVQTSIGPDGIGLCSTTLFDEQGALGRSMQTLEVRPRD
ncbi:thioesterase family protein [Nocardia huaxiensis]|uniref:Thioesterase family protein n=1 Tax=Nocardia huaxiensis TaxID=2755382 RepID=A0A7D6V838_9NOCA|nr:thioesterase family protein [Nocardia huaxiensis]QLY27942.1 thioesterase family protein [Nocardia huaxiensis]UFS98647.1 thioesterase family protein [Nocardia huaxiensis]